MGWNYGIPVPGGGPGQLAAGHMTIIAGRLFPAHRVRHTEEFRPELLELYRHSRPVNALRQPSQAPATRRGLAEEPPAHDTGLGRLP